MQHTEPRVTEMNTETTYNDYQTVVDAAPERSAGSRITAAIRRAARRVMKSMIRSHWERHAVRELNSLPSYVLRDIGIGEGEIREVAADLARDRADAWARRASGANGFGG